LAKPKKWPSMIRNVSLVNGQTDRLALPYTFKQIRTLLEWTLVEQNLVEYISENLDFGRTGLWEKGIW
jgi:hypothetical protein